MELASTRNHLQRFRLDCFLFLVSQFLSTGYLELQEKVMIPVAANDVAFSTHAVLLTAITLYQVLIYDCGNQKVSKTCIAITSIVWVSAAVCVFIAWPNNSWLWLISVFNGIQVIMTVLKYIPQALMNFMRKSTEGWSIGNILLDLFGGLMNYAQMAMQSIDQGSWINFYGNIGKTLLSLASNYLAPSIEVEIEYHTIRKDLFISRAKVCNNYTSDLIVLVGTDICLLFLPFHLVLSFFTNCKYTLTLGKFVDILGALVSLVHCCFTRQRRIEGFQ
ncbi:PREDICTED: cystinosin homolog isoform X4 [Nelumbo nucifera]|uniref:Cystinosin homolog isoform X4 n=1 Tax=Nelumbo nucifera TaxID=4432 RepID=A0A1U7ZLL9_NELNU|nr:PREDICTED: cystinosin homolog isoform X4 [Nelumbo nucifera]